MRMSLTAAACALLVALPGPLRAADWKPIDPADLALKAPKVQRDADAEAIFWDVRVRDELAGINLEPTTIFEHYLRIKIFTERGRERHATIDLPFINGIRISNVEARTVRANGSIVDLQRSDIYRRTLVKAEGFKLQTVSFAVPGIERGAIIEYRWRETRRESLANFLRLHFSRDIPIQTVNYHLRPLTDLPLSMRAIPFNASPSPPQRQRDGSLLVSLTNVPAHEDEPYAPPPYERRPWLFLYYGISGDGPAARFWESLAAGLHDSYAKRARPNDDIRRLAAAAVGAAKTPGERLAALAAAVRERVRRVDVDTADANDARKARENRNASDVLKRGAGDADDVVVLLLALASAAGLDARVAAAPDRADIFHTPAHRHSYFVRHRLVAVRDGNGWIFADPANEHAAAGALRWNLEHQEVLIGDPDRLVTAMTPLSPAERTGRRRTADVTLLEDGTLEGECRIVYSGHWNDLAKEDDDHETPADREKSYRDVLTKRLPSAEIATLKLENVTEPGREYTATYRVRVPGFAARTGTRLILQPAFFQKGEDAVFTAAERRAEVYFPFPWHELDRVTIALPEGFDLEQPEAPAGATSNVGRHSITLSQKDGRRTLVLERRFDFGISGSLRFPRESYEALKRFLDRVHASDAHSLVLRRRDAQQ